VETKYVSQSNNELSFHEILNILRKRFLIIVSMFIIVILVTFIYLKFFATPIYEATAKIKIPTSSGGIGSLGSAAALILGSGASSPDLATQQEMIYSRPVLEEVIKRTNLLEIKKSEVKKNKNTVTIDSLIYNLRSEKVLSIKTVKNSPIVEIRIADSNRELALKILTELVKVYITTYVKLNKDEKTSQLEIVEKQILQLEKEIAELGEKMKQFKLTKSISPSDEGQLYVTALTKLSQDRYETQGEIETTKEAINKIKQQINTLQIEAKTTNYTPTSELLEKYRANLAELQTKYNSAIQQYTENHPEVKSLKAQIEQLEAEINKEIKRIANSKIESPSPLMQELYTQLVQNQLKLPILQTKLDAINRSIADTESKMKKLPQIEQEYLNLERDYRIKQTIYAALIQKYEELRLNAVSSEVNKPQIVDPPYVPDTPSKPDKKLTLAIGGTLGIFLGIIGAFLREITDKKIRTAEEIEKFIRVPIIIHSRENKKQAVQTMLNYVLSNYTDHRKIGIISPDNKESVDTTLELISDIFTKSSTKFVVIEIKQKESVLIAKTMEREINEKMKEYDYLIITSEPFRNNYDALIVSKKSDGVILTLKLNSSEKSEVLKTVHLLEQNGVIIYGIIAF